MLQTEKYELAADRTVELVGNNIFKRKLRVKIKRLRAYNFEENMTTDTRRRVKLYALNAERQWDDRGTGHVSSNYVDRLKGISLLVRAESDGSLLLESKIQPDTAYQKQQDTLIVWSEGDNFDLALSFQEKAGCDEIWEKICQVQGKDPSVEITQDIVEESEDERFEDMSDTAPPIELPPCELARLEEISETIQNCLTTPLRKEKLSMALESENYIKKLLNLFHVCEDLDNTEGLHHLFEIFKNIFLLNKNALFEIMFAEDTIFDVVGCLEYDPSSTQPKKHRQYLKQWAKFREAVPIKNQDLLAKIHQTFRVQYIQDIILPTPSVFVEDNMLNTLSSFIFFNKVEIVTLIQEDERFLVDMFTILTDPSTSDAKRRDIVLFLKEFCNYAQNLQPQGKDSFYKTLTCLGILQALEITLVMNDQKTKSASIDILTAIVEFSPLVVRNYTLQQLNRTEGDRMLLNIAIEQMLSDSEPELGVAVQLMGIIKILLEPESMLTEKADFLNFFYKHSIQTLIAPLLINTIGDRPDSEDYQTAQLLGIVLDILSFCVEHHTYHIKNFIIQKDLLKRILVLMKSTHTFLVLGALRLLRKIIALKDEFYNRHIVKGNLFAPVVDAFIRNNGRYNLLESAILELFEFVKLEDIKTLCVYFVENFSKIFDEIEYVQTFKYLKNRYDQYQDRIKDRDKMSLDTSLPIIRSRFRRDPRQMDDEEEMWFNEEEDFADEYDTYNSVMKSVTEKNGPSQSPSQQSSIQQKSPPQGALLGSSSSVNSLSSTTTTATTLTPAVGVSGVGGVSSISGVSLSDVVSNASNSSSLDHTQSAAAATQAHLGAAAVAANIALHHQQQTALHNFQQQQQLNLNSTLVAAAAAAAAGVASTSAASAAHLEAQNQHQHQHQHPEHTHEDPDIVELRQHLVSIVPQHQELTLAAAATSSSTAVTGSVSSAVAALQSQSLASTSIATPSTSSALSESAVAAAAAASQLLTSIASSDAVAAVAAAAAAAVAATVTGVTPNMGGGGGVVTAANLAAAANAADTLALNVGKHNDSGDNMGNGSGKDGAISSVVTGKKGLVDYESDSGDEDDYEEEEEEESPHQKKPRMA
ncbi:PREDICTED: serine/threonine-protein phosphatase 4 regulatory subunit 3 isoform X1 [Bactrocera latifrons]|uniref:Serine/threonine-protein phosphatase 4 regulatory subunit 3 n=2 Tax=Bactrocera latifrons TaxID=174628 RepID=A0A0K8V5N8_BACLA|nr:PREDICTED: serine/threonine-protein phosphatase 4 regulatory subunit 3 isoform X1 [Bactrocera latifrons]XP_018797329.1 PREDICTED: serine/threonine-protein phosphatase 4 regulatory subunit 3 isoform X1 [Bactrocera latifrons]XP_018797330.1 PREDICTED: serine/threonine-protein phosphatase 4 regulatory subunit 3 isoform X1 [Bactrocera latifrons]XP_018797331.1 PREDICTED: serine/threonine-protein phosphatase 4 regulatory subunit 3 isoform X1 [Bactrocera latifrons]XP_018797332.1 PREDICTED: serine/th